MMGRVERGEKLVSEFVNQIARFYTDSLGNQQKRMKADPLFTTFNFTDIDRMQVGLFSQLFLTQTCHDAVLENGFAKKFKLL